MKSLAVISLLPFMAFAACEPGTKEFKDTQRFSSGYVEGLEKTNDWNTIHKLNFKLPNGEKYNINNISLTLRISSGEQKNNHYVYVNTENNNIVTASQVPPGTQFQKINLDTRIYNSLLKQDQFTVGLGSSTDTKSIEWLYVAHGILSFCYSSEPLNSTFTIDASSYNLSNNNKYKVTLEKNVTYKMTIFGKISGQDDKKLNGLAISYNNKSHINSDIVKEGQSYYFTTSDGIAEIFIPVNYANGEYRVNMEKVNAS
ncbi:hypothetical protein [Aeromonas dhakensis]|uniref:hypothetical protein n=1 Tax=Aeromonas dhakensis TaxID=196024 RepID=UPI0013DC6231|nr:hypothetical protein [Aeromonas dhakensis]WAG00755.1 hypothetical protein NRZ31_08280 [Aeromonas dhakensis]